MLIGVLGIASISMSYADPQKMLVLLDSSDLQQSHSKFIQLASKGFETSVVTVDSETTKLKEWDRWLYDKLLIVGGSQSTYSDLTDWSFESFPLSFFSFP